MSQLSWGTTNIESYYMNRNPIFRTFSFTNKFTIKIQTWPGDIWLALDFLCIHGSAIINKFRIPSYMHWASVGGEHYMHIWMAENINSKFESWGSVVDGGGPAAFGHTFYLHSTLGLRICKYVFKFMNEIETDNSNNNGNKKYCTISWWFYVF